MTQHRGSIVYLGAGLCSDLEDHLSSNPERIYLVEPNPALRDELTQLCEKHPIVEHLACGVTPEGGQKSLNVYNFFDLSSFSVPDTLLEIYPGALVDATPQVSTLTPADLLAQLNLHPKAANTLILETTGIEHAVLDAFATSGVLQSFSTLSLKMPAHTLFHGSRSIEDIDALVEGAGYWKSAQLDVSDNPDWHQCTYTFDRQAHFALKEQQAAVETIAKENAQTIAMLKKQSADLHAERDKAREQLATVHSKDAIAKVADLATQNASLNKEAVMALRIQARLQSNQQDLQTRFTAMQNEKHAQDELVTALVQKLEDMLASTPAKATKSRKKRTPMTKGASRKKAAGT